MSTSTYAAADSLLLYTTPASSGLGGAFGAVADDNSAIILNPAGMSNKPTYGASTGYLYDSLSNEQRLDLCVTDSITSPVAVGFGYYRYSYQQGSLGIDKNVYALALSMGKPGIFSGGITGRLDQYTGGLSGNAGTLGYGLIFSPGLPYLNISIAGLNLTKIQGTPQQLPPRLIDAGISLLSNGMLTLAFDAVKNLDVNGPVTMDYHAGGEIDVLQSLALRGGYAWDDVENMKTFSAGIGWYGPRFTIAYTFVGNVRNLNNNTQTASFILYPF